MYINFFNGVKNYDVKIYTAGFKNKLIEQHVQNLLNFTKFTENNILVK